MITPHEILPFLVVPVIIYYVMGFVTLILVLGHHRALKWEQRFPPISDKEFVKKCRPGTNPDIAIRVRHLIAKHLGVDVNRIHPEMTFVGDLDCC